MHDLSLFFSLYRTEHNTQTNVWQNPKHLILVKSLAAFSGFIYMPDCWFCFYRQHLHEYCIKINHFSHIHLTCTNSKHCDITERKKKNTVKDKVKNSMTFQYLCFKPTKKNNIYTFKWHLIMEKCAQPQKNKSLCGHNRIQQE